MTSLEKLTENHPDLVKEYSGMSKEQLLEQICAEVLDLHKMEERVSVFMAECTDDMSNTNYTPESIKTLVNQKSEKDTNEYCAHLLDLSYADMVEEVTGRAKETK